MEIRKVLVLSTSHITPDTLQSTAWPKIGNFEYGAYFYVPTNGDSDLMDEQQPADLYKVMKFAQSIDAHEVKFDCDADTIDGLPVYAWE